MRTKLLIIFIALTIQGMCQDKSYIELRKEYKAYCNEIVVDTLIERGVVNYEIGDGLKLIPKDTVWNEVKCAKYKNSSGWNHRDLSLTYNYDTLSTYTHTTLLNHRHLYSEPSVQRFQTSINRQKFCEIRRCEENMSDFWEWVETNYLKIK